ncbi:MAG TPA: hypothetical protein PLS95_16325 [Thermoanaerobaculales bacterium]|nr:hypothetical protein [Thermoanaerobaculales bacterium]HQN96636.1 hypothetical protein [Thermoanaerobaculales bacterium]HQP44358.1 hypothetical protein [Thermoanaerobaculales bacterium]
MVSDLLDMYSDRLAVVEYHVFGDGYDVPWGDDRLSDFYSGWCGDVLPIVMYDGYWFWYEAGDLADGLRDRLGESTDVTIELTAREVREAVWTVMAEVCIEPGGNGKRMRIYTVDALDHWPDDPSYSRNTLRQAAATQDVDLDAGECAVVESTFTFDDTSWDHQDDIRIVAWASETANVGPANVFQAAQMAWPFPQAGSAEPEYPRGFNFTLPLYDGEWSAWLEDARPAAVLADSPAQVQATYQVLCGDTSGLYPVGDPPTTDQPIPQVRIDDGALPIFAAGSGTQEVLLCDYDGFGHYPNAKWGVPTEGGPVEVPACSGEVRPSGPAGLESDGYLVLYKVATATAYDFRQATTVRAGECQSQGAGLPGFAVLEAAQADFGDVNGSGANPTGVWSARAAGTPLLAGAILPEDVEAGDINHALAVAIPGLRNLAPDPASPLASDVVYPASTTDGDRYSINPDALAAGQRLRLKGTLVAADGSTVNEQGLSPITKMFLRALRRFGAYVVDTADGFAFFAEDIHSAVLELDDADVNALIGQPAATPLPSDTTKWQLVIETLNQELAGIPFAAGPCDGVATTVETANFVVVEPADAPPAPVGGMRRFRGRLIPGAP